MRNPFVAVLALAFVPLGAQAAEIGVLSAGATRAVVEILARQFEAASGHKVAIVSDNAGGIQKRVEAGEAYDLVIVTPSVIDALVAKGKLAAGSRVDIATVGIGVGIREGAPRPDISTVEGFFAALRSARAIAYSAGTSGLYVKELIERQGLGAELAPKTRVKSSGYAAEFVASGEADIAIQQASEIIPVKGVTLIGPLPAPIQLITTYSGALGMAPRDPAATRALLAHLTGPNAGPVLTLRGLSVPGK